MSCEHPDLLVLGATGNERQRWLGELAEWSEREVFAHPGYLELFAPPGTQALCLIYNHGRCKVLYPLLLRNLALLPFWKGDERFDIVSPPYGYGGPFVVGTPHISREEILRQFYVTFTRWARQAGVVSEYCTFSPFLEPSSYPGDVVARAPTVIRDLRPTMEAIWADYKGSVRTDIAKARRLGISIEVDTEGRYVSDFLGIYSHTMERRRAANAYQIDREFLRSLHSSVQGQLAYFHARHEGRIVSSELVLLSATSAFFFRGGTFADKLNTSANVLLKHHIVQWSKTANKTGYVLGGGNSAEDSLFKYKRSFAPRGVQPLFTGRWVIDSDVYASAVAARRTYECDLRGDWNPAPYFPIYRAPSSQT